MVINLRVLTTQQVVIKFAIVVLSKDVYNFLNTGSVNYIYSILFYDRIKYLSPNSQPNLFPSTKSF